MSVGWGFKIVKDDAIPPFYVSLSEELRNEIRQQRSEDGRHFSLELADTVWVKIPPLEKHRYEPAFVFSFHSHGKFEARLNSKSLHIFSIKEEVEGSGEELPLIYFMNLDHTLTVGPPRRRLESALLAVLPSDVSDAPSSSQVAAVRLLQTSLETLLSRKRRNETASHLAAVRGKKGGVSDPQPKFEDSPALIEALNLFQLPQQPFLTSINRTNVDISSFVFESTVGLSGYNQVGVHNLEENLEHHAYRLLFLLGHGKDLNGVLRGGEASDQLVNTVKGMACCQVVILAGDNVAQLAKDCAKKHPTVAWYFSELPGEDLSINPLLALFVLFYLILRRNKGHFLLKSPKGKEVVEGEAEGEGEVLYPGGHDPTEWSPEKVVGELKKLMDATVTYYHASALTSSSPQVPVLANSS